MIFTNQGHKFWGFIGQSYLKITLDPIRTQNLGSLLMKLRQSIFNLRSPNCYLLRSYLIATVWQCSRKPKKQIVLALPYRYSQNFDHIASILNTKRCLKLKWCGYSSMFTSYAKQEMFCATIYQGCRHLPWGPGYCQKFEIFSGPLSSSLFTQLRHLSGYNLD